MRHAPRFLVLLTRPILAGALLSFMATIVAGCGVISVVGAAAGAVVSVAGEVVSTTVKVTGKVIEKTIDVVTPSSPPPAAPK